MGVGAPDHGHDRRLGCLGRFFLRHSNLSAAVQLTSLDQYGDAVGTPFSKTFAAWTYLSFNPFVVAGVGSGIYDNCRLYIQPTVSGNSGAGTWGLFCFGSSANNTTNDTCAHIAVQLQ